LKLDRFQFSIFGKWRLEEFYFLMADLVTNSGRVEQVFLSYSRTDTDAAIALRCELEKGGVNVFRDEESVRVGDNWVDRLQTALQDCSAFVLLLGQDAVQRWVGAEVQVALIRNLSAHDEAGRLPIFPIALPGSDLEKLPPFLALFQVQQWTPGDALSDEMLTAIRDKVALLDGIAGSWPAEESPFLGLAAFQPKQAHLFFGRRRETLDALKCLGTQAQTHPQNINASSGIFCRWLQIEGNSGSGKSSLVNAGMLPLIEQGLLWSRTGFAKWKIIGPMMPGEKPLDRLARILDQALIPDPEKRDHKRRLTRLEDGDSRVFASMLKDVAEDDTAFILVVDQFEELFTFSDPTEKLHFDAQLANVLQDIDCPLFLITTVRIDFLEGFEQLPRLSGLYNAACKRYLLKTITAGGLQEVIEQPARLAGLDVSEITTAMLGDAADEVGALPLVENALHYLWEQRQGNRLSGALYRDKGRIAGLLEVQADALLARLEREVPKGKQKALELLLALTRINPEGRHTRQRISLEEARAVAGDNDPECGQKVINYLSGRPEPGGSDRGFNGSLRLITSVGESQTDNGNGVPDTVRSVTSESPEFSASPPRYTEQYVDLIHETLIRARGKDPNTGALMGYWKSLYAYIEKNRGRPFYRDQLKLQAESWRTTAGIGRVRKLAGWRDLGFYRKLRPSKQSIESRFLFWSRLLRNLQWGVLALILAFFGESYWWTLKNEFPPSYMLMQQRFRLMNVGWLAEPSPVMIEIPVKVGVMFQIGEANAEFAEKYSQANQQRLGYPPVDVLISKPYSLSKYEITYEQYDFYVWKQRRVGIDVDYPDTGPGGRGYRPVVNVNWLDADAYLTWLSNKTRDRYRLPNEAEWEYAARAGSKSPYWWGKEIGIDNANCDGCGSEWDNDSSAPVGSFKPNNFHLYDTAGNVWEWTCSVWEGSLKSGENLCVNSGDRVSRVIRGGSWFHPG